MKFTETNSTKFHWCSVHYAWVWGIGLAAFIFIVFLMLFVIPSDDKSFQTERSMSREDKLRAAIRDKDYKTLEQLIAAGTDINDSENGAFEHSPLWWAIEMDDVEMFEFLLNRGVTLLPPDTTEEVWGGFPTTPLFEAVLGQKQNVAEYIIAHDLLTNKDLSPEIFQAAVCMRNYEIIKSILQRNPATVTYFEQANFFYINNPEYAPNYEKDYTIMRQRLKNEGILE